MCIVAGNLMDGGTKRCGMRGGEGACCKAGFVNRAKNRSYERRTDYMKRRGIDCTEVRGQKVKYIKLIKSDLNALLGWPLKQYLNKI